MQSPAAFISFKNGVCRRLRARSVPGQVEEAIRASSSTGIEANLLADDLSIVARTVSTPGALDGFVVVSESHQ